ncbi:FtsX-like permease family protein [Parapedobacter lycopersici]|uniref:ABC transporter permease n=1 Tax=Parapedobacter lycopersici TaxID=1864939 RepID=UPI0033422358
MNILHIAWKNIRQNPAASILGILLTAFGTGILCVLLVASKQIEQQLTNNSQGIDLVVGAKGSPIQLMLSSIYHIDNPTGNISYREARALAANRLVKLAVPLSLGDNYQGHRIVGTDSSFLQLYSLELEKGRLWQSDFEVVVGTTVARDYRLQLGDQLYGAHGLSKEGNTHSHPYTIVGILQSAKNVADRLVLTNLASVWHTHEDAHGSGGENPENEPENAPIAGQGLPDNQPPQLVKNMLEGFGSGGREITSLLIQYSNPSAIAILPRLVNQSTSMQAASPALESARLFSLLGIGIDSIEVLAYVIMVMAALSVFISLYSALKRRKYDLAIMRTLGASQGKLFGIVIAEGILLTFTGALVGLIIGHLAFFLISIRTGDAATLLQASTLYLQEIWLLATGVLIGLLAAALPAIKAYNTSISKTLSGTQ